MTKLLVWGNNASGALGLGGTEEEQICTPTLVKWSEEVSVIKVALGMNHTLFLTDDGKVYSCGSNDYSQLGRSHSKRTLPQKVSGMESQEIVSVACGSRHSLALNKWGEVFAWGANDHGQLGYYTKDDSRAEPQLLKKLANVVQIAAGDRHSVALSNAGVLYTWGANDFNQLGLLATERFVYTPTPIKLLNGIPFVFIACGGNHSFALSKSCAIYGWGKNNKGQLGTNEFTLRPNEPRQLKGLRSTSVKYISCGDEFSIFLTQSGSVFSCGAGTYGQLGHGNSLDEVVPRQIVELMGVVTSQIYSGRQHSLAYVSSNGLIYGYGLGGSGQLGVSHITGRKIANAPSPQVVFGSPKSKNFKLLRNKLENASIIKSIFAGGDQCAVLVGEKNSSIVPNDYRNHSDHILTLKLHDLQFYKDIDDNMTVDQDVMKNLEVILKNSACLNGSFLKKNNGHFNCSEMNHGVDMDEATEAFRLIANVKNTTLINLIENCLIECTESLKMECINRPPLDKEALRIFLVLPLYHKFKDARLYKKLQLNFAGIIYRLPDKFKKTLFLWWSSTSKEYFTDLIRSFADTAELVIKASKFDQNGVLLARSIEEDLVIILKTLEFLNDLNRSLGMKVPYDTFYIRNLSEIVNVKADYYFCQHTNLPGFYLFQFPFIFDTVSKINCLHVDLKLEMESAIASTAIIDFANFELRADICFRITVNRNNIISDAITALSRAYPIELKKPLKVEFAGEEAEDAGGVQKEFFSILTRNILDPNFGMFGFYEENHALWFTNNNFDDTLEMYIHIGTICGLALYNSVLVPLPFPLALYKKILGQPVGLEDLKDIISPMRVRALEDLLDYAEPDFQDVFGLYFQISIPGIDGPRTYDLKPFGKDIAVTQENKKEYVDLHVDFYLNTLIKKQYEAFYIGFRKVCSAKVFRLFLADELMAAVIGNENYDWEVFQQTAQYKNCTSSDEVIQWFWEVLKEMTLAEKKKFLFFLTGSDRIPFQGMQSLNITIQTTNDIRRLPCAHTCFNILDLPRYTTKERLRYKLMQAIFETDGFGLA